MITPNSYQAQKEGRAYQPQQNVDRMQGSDSEQQGQQWVGEDPYTSAPQQQSQAGQQNQEQAGQQYQGQQPYPQQYQGQPVQQYPGQPYPQGYPQPYPQEQAPEAKNPNAKSKAAAAALAFFLTPFGAANFYLKYTTMAVIQLVLNIIGMINALIGIVLVVKAFSLETLDDLDYMVPGMILLIIASIFYFALLIWAAVDFIRILAETPPYDKDADGIPLEQ